MTMARQISQDPVIADLTAAQLRSRKAEAKRGMKALRSTPSRDAGLRAAEDDLYDSMLDQVTDIEEEIAAR
jgi:hypothetical protein